MLRRPLFRYLLTTFGISWGCWGLEAILIKMTVLTAAHPLAMLLFIACGFGPTIAALSLLEGGVKRKTLKDFLFRKKAGSRPFAALILAMAFETAVLACFSDGLRPEIPRSWIALPVALVTFLLASFLFGGNEELGWRGTLQPLLQKKLPLSLAILMVGLVWVFWHTPLWFIEGDSHQALPFLPFAFFGLFLSFWLGLLYEYSGAVIIPMLFHGWTNTLLGVLVMRESTAYYLGLSLITLILLVGAFAYRNLHFDYGHDRFMEMKGKACGFVEKRFICADGSEIAYLEGPKHGDALLLIHGQMVSKEDYAAVLPDLSRHFHIFAVDCYGHGNSSKDPKKYNILSLRDDLIVFMKEVIREKTYLSGHSSGALISTAIAAKHKEQVKGLLLEDGPFFSTEKGRAEKTLAYLEFKTIHEFLSQNSEKNYTKYYLDHTSMKEQFNEDGRDNWSRLVRNPFLKRLNAKRKNSGKMPMVWYYPPKIKLNELVFLTRNMKDGSGQYDLRFAEAFYDFSFFKGFDQEQTLSEIECPTVILHVAPSPKTAPSYVDKNGILLSAMDEKDAEKVHALIKWSCLKSGYASPHDIHADLPRLFIEAVLEMQQKSS